MCVWNSILETWIPTLAPHIPQALIFVKRSSYQVVRWLNWGVIILYRAQKKKKNTFSYCWWICFLFPFFLFLLHIHIKLDFAFSSLVLKSTLMMSIKQCKQNDVLIWSQKKERKLLENNKILQYFTHLILNCYEFVYNLILFWLMIG